MTNPKSEPHHNICGCSSRDFSRTSSVDLTRQRGSEAGYTLVALLALMTIVALFAMAVAPEIQQQAQREREKEAIYRGEQVADAIRDYYLYRAAVMRLRGDQALPTSMDQLLEGIPVPGGAKKRQILRASAAIDPLSREGEWRFVHPRTQGLIEFQRAVLTYSGTFVPVPRNQQMAQLQQLAVPQITSLLNVGDDDKSSSGTAAADDSTGPFVGVATRNSNKSVLTYYGIDQLDQWIFTPLFRN